MKRVISLLLCIVMCASVFSATGTVVYAQGKTDAVFTVEKTEFKNDSITYTISLAPNQKKIIGAVIKAEFDSTVLEVSEESGPAGKSNNYGDYIANVTGYYETGITYDNDNVYSVAYMNPNGFDIDENGKEFIKIKFTAIGDKRPYTDVKIYCDEYVTDDGDDSNDIKKSDNSPKIYEDKFFTLNPAVNKEVASTQTGLKFTWTAAVGAEKYNIYRKTEDTNWSLYTTVDAGVTEYTDEAIKKGVEYYYSVESANEYGVREYDKTGMVGLNFGTITNIGATLTERGASVSWGALANASSYTVYRKAEGDASWDKIAEVTDTVYEDEPLTSNVKYFYTVKAHHEKGYVAETSVDPAEITFIANAVIVEYQLNYNDIVINWQNVDGAVKYEIYRKAEGESAYKYVAEVDIPGYTDTDVENKKTYSYQVRSINGSGVGSVRGTEGFDLVKLPITTKVVASLGSDNVTVSWESTELATGYEILRRDGNSSNWFTIARVDAPSTKYEDHAVKSGKTYTYAVKSKKEDIQTSPSNPSNAVYYLVAPVISGVENISKGLKLSFEKVDGADSYNIYRREVNSQFGEPIANVLAGGESVYTDATAVSGVQYVYGVQSVHGEVTSGISSSSTVCCLVEPEFTLKSTYVGINIKWSAVPGAEKYVVYFGLSNKIDKMVSVYETTDTSYVFKNGTGGRNNYFAVEAVCGETVSAKSQQHLYYLEAPEMEVLDNGIDQVTFRWNDVVGVDSYIVYRKAEGEKKWTKLKTTEDTFYKDKNVKSGVKYTYTVKGFDGEEYTPYNPEGWSIVYMSTPTVKSVTNAYGGPQIKWSSVNGASKYYIYRRTKSTNWKAIDTTKSTSYIDKSAKSNTKYYYAVRAGGSSGKSYASNSYYDSIAKAVSYLGAPVVKIENATNGIQVSWGKVSGAEKYIVYRKAGSEKGWTKVKTTTATAYTDKNVKHGKTYTYTVKAVKGNLNSGYNTSGFLGRFISAPKLKSVSSAKKGVTFKWNKVSGVSGYYVYRKTGSGSYEKIAKVKGASNVSYVDSTAKKGKTYTYTVRAYYSSYLSGYYSGLKITDKY